MAAKEITIAPLLPAQREAVARMWVAFFEAHQSAPGSPIVIGSAARLRSEIDHWLDLILHGEEQLGLVAADESAPCGFIAVWTRLQPWFVPEQFGTVIAIWVAPEHRRRGIGGRLVTAASDALAARAIDTMHARAIVSLRGAGDFWAAMGFAPLAVELQRRTGRPGGTQPREA